jgi:small GTP-binding protein
MTKIVELPNKRKAKISLWDTAGQERYKALSKVYYKGANAAIVVYDITDPNTYVDVEGWMKLLSKNGDKLDENLNIEDIVLALVGNKVDLEGDRRVPSERPVQEYREAFGIDCWEVSAKTGYQIEALFADIVQSTHGINSEIVDKTSDIKSTVYRGTVEYADSERGTLVGAGKYEGANQGQYAVRDGSIIIEV